MFRVAAFLLGLGVVAVAPSWSEDLPGEWTYHGGNFANAKYSPLSQITADNFDEVSIAWRWASIETQITAKDPRIVPSQFKPTPLVVDGIMYLPTSVGQVVALDPGTGEVQWEFDTKAYQGGRPANVGFQHRGVSYWTDGEIARVLIAASDRTLWSLDAKTGEPDEAFGKGGVVDLSGSLGRDINPRMITHTSPVGVCNDTIIVGSIIFDGPTLKEMPPGHVRGFDARTGEMKWIFHTIPQEAEFGSETWENESWKYSGNTNVWSMFSTDEELNRIYLPVSTPTTCTAVIVSETIFSRNRVCVSTPIRASGYGTSKRCTTVSGIMIFQRHRTSPTW